LLSLPKNDLAFLPHDLQQHLAAEADIAELVALGVDRRLCWVVRLPVHRSISVPSPFEHAGIKFPEGEPPRLKALNE
jgi:hypothetical protein